MPLSQIKKCYYRLFTDGIRERLEIIEKMAALFQVSCQAMRIRLEKHRLV